MWYTQHKFSPITLTLKKKSSSNPIVDFVWICTKKKKKKKKTYFGKNIIKMVTRPFHEWRPNKKHAALASLIYLFFFNILFIFHHFIHLDPRSLYFFFIYSLSQTIFSLCLYKYSYHGSNRTQLILTTCATWPFSLLSYLRESPPFFNCLSPKN